MLFVTDQIVAGGRTSAIWITPVHIKLDKLDVSAVLTALLESPSWGPRIDPGRIGAAGFSLGGYTMAEMDRSPCALFSDPLGQDFRRRGA